MSFLKNAIFGRWGQTWLLQSCRSTFPAKKPTFKTVITFCRRNFDKKGSMDGLLAASVLQRNDRHPLPYVTTNIHPPLLLLSGKYFGSFERDSTCSREREKNQIICFFPSLLLPKLSWGRRQNCGSQKKMWNDLRLFSEISDDVEKKRWSFISLQLTQIFKKLRGSIFSLQSLKRMKKREKLITELCRKRIWQSIEEETREIL